MHIENEYTGVMPWTSADFSGSAHFFLMADDFELFQKLYQDNRLLSKGAFAAVTAERLLLDLVISRVDFQYAEADQLDPHVGDSFSHHFFGDTPITLSVTGVLADTTRSVGKSVLVELYRWLFRLRQVVRTGIAPALSFVGGTAQGAMLGLDVNENAQRPDFLDVQFSFLVLALQFSSPENAGAKTLSMEFAARSAHVAPPKVLHARIDPEIEALSATALPSVA